jgi:SAM-dependent methyltransferase
MCALVAAVQSAGGAAYSPDLVRDRLLERVPPAFGTSYPAWVPGGQVEESVWDRLAPTYGLAEPDHFSEFARRLVRRVPLGPGAVVLDLACGAGALVSAVAVTAPSASLVAVDLSVEMLRRTALELLPRAARVAEAAMNAQLLAFTDRAFGTVLCGSALDSFPDPAQALAEMHRVLRPGGAVGLWVAPSWWWQDDPRWNWHDDLLASVGADVGRVPAGLDGPASLQRTIRGAGFQDVRVSRDEFAFRFGDADQWWQWIWSHGFRQVLEQLSVGHLAIYRRTAFERIGHRGIAGRMEALMAVARRHEW